MLNKINLFILNIFIFLVIFDPKGTIFKIKNLSFVILGLIYIINLFLNKKVINKKILITFSLIMFLSLTSVIVGLIKHVDYSGYFIMRTYIFFFCMFLIYTIEEETLKVYSRFCIVLSIVSILIQLALLKDEKNIRMINIIFKNFLGESLYITPITQLKSLGINYLGRLSKVYFSVSATSIFALAYYVKKFKTTKKKKNAVFSIIIILGLISSGTRANIITGLCTLILVYFAYSKKINKKKIIVIISIFFMSMSIWNKKKIGEMFSTSDKSNSRKLSYLSAYADIFSKTDTLIFGNGIGAVTRINDEMLMRTELSYLEIFKEFGVIMGIVFLLILFYPISVFIFNYKKLKEKQYLIIAYVMFLLQNIINPVLLNSQGILMFSIVFCSVLHYGKRKVKLKGHPRLLVLK